MAPGGIIKKCYPLKGNESIIEGNLLTSPNRKTESLKAIESSQLTLAGPFELSQGGVGTIGRYPVFISGKDGKKHFWGFTIVVIDLIELLDKTGISKLDQSGYDYWLWRIHPDTKLPEIFASSVKKPNHDLSIDFSINVPNSTWTLSAMPKAGWINKGISLIWHICLILISLVLSIFVYLLLQRTALLKDRTENLKRSKQELIEANATKDKFFSIIAHDLRSPVGSLLSISQLLSDNYQDLDEKERMNLISFIKLGSNQTLTLLDNLLLWARSQSGNIEWKPAKFDINDTINNVVILFENAASNKQQQIIVETKGVLQVFADKDMITTVLRNLVSNAIKFSPINRRIVICTSESNKSTCEIKVKDYGIGIPPEKLTELFQLDNNQSTKGTNNESGTGLGLLLCKEFIELNNGKIMAESVLNEGSSFFITIPLASAEMQ